MIRLGRQDWRGPLFPITYVCRCSCTHGQQVAKQGGGHRVGYQPRDGWWCRFLVPVFCKTHLVPGTKFRVVSCFFWPDTIFSLVPGTICMQKLCCKLAFFISLNRIGCFVWGGTVNRETDRIMLRSQGRLKSSRPIIKFEPTTISWLKTLSYATPCPSSPSPSLSNSDICFK